MHSKAQTDANPALITSLLLVLLFLCKPLNAHSGRWGDTLVPFATGEAASVPILTPARPPYAFNAGYGVFLGGQSLAEGEIVEAGAGNSFTDPIGVKPLFIGSPFPNHVLSRLQESRMGRPYSFETCYIYTLPVESTLAENHLKGQLSLRLENPPRSVSAGDYIRAAGKSYRVRLAGTPGSGTITLAGTGLLDDLPAGTPVRVFATRKYHRPGLYALYTFNALSLQGTGQHTAAWVLDGSVSNQPIINLLRGTSAFDLAFSNWDNPTYNPWSGRPFEYEDVLPIWLQGERDAADDQSEAYYREHFIRWLSDFRDRSEEFLGFRSTIPVFYMAVCSHTAYGFATPRGPQICQFSIWKELPEDFVCVGPNYPFASGDQVHPTRVAYWHMGNLIGNVLFEVLAKGNAWQPLHLTQAEFVSATEIKATFHVPFPPLAFDEGTWITPLAQKGFEYQDDGPALLMSVEIDPTAPDSVRLKLDAPAGENPRLRYAWTGKPQAAAGSRTGARGQLCDSSPFITLSGKTFSEEGDPVDELPPPLRLPNFSLPFDVALPYSSTPQASYRIRFNPGLHGTLPQANTGVSYTIAVPLGGHPLAPEVQADAGFVFSGWFPPLPRTFDAPFETTAQFVENKDPDRDGLCTLEETRLKTDPFNPDSDEDGLLDGPEVNNGLDPLVSSLSPELYNAFIESLRHTQAHLDLPADYVHVKNGRLVLELQPLSGNSLTGLLPLGSSLRLFLPLPEGASHLYRLSEE